MNNILNFQKKIKQEEFEREEVIKFKEQFWADILICSPLLLNKLLEILTQSSSRDFNNLYFNSGSMRVFMESKLIECKRVESHNIYYLVNPTRIYNILQFINNNIEDFNKYYNQLVELFQQETIDGRELRRRRYARIKFLKLIYLLGEKDPFYKKFKPVLEYEHIQDYLLRRNFYFNISAYLDDCNKLNSQTVGFIDFMIRLINYQEKDEINIKTTNNIEIQDVVLLIKQILSSIEP